MVVSSQRGLNLDLPKMFLRKILDARSRGLPIHLHQEKHLCYKSTYIGKCRIKCSIDFSRPTHEAIRPLRADSIGIVLVVKPGLCKLTLRSKIVSQIISRGAKKMYTWKIKKDSRKESICISIPYYFGNGSMTQGDDTENIQ